MPVDVGHGDPHGIGPHEVTVAAVDRRPELSVAEPGVDQDVVAAAVGDDQVGDAVAVQVSQRHGAGVEQSGGLIGQNGGIAGAVVNDHAVETLIGVNDVLRAVASQVGDGQFDRLICLAVGREGAIAVAEKYQDITINIADQDVELAVVRQVNEAQPIRFRGHRVSRRGQESPLTIAQEDAHPVGGEHSQVFEAIACENAHSDDLGRARLVWMVAGLANRPAPSPTSTPSVYVPGLIVTRSV